MITIDNISTGVSKFVKYFKIRWFCVEKVKIEALKGKIFNFNENNEHHKVYPSACVSVSVSAIWLPPSSYWRLCNFDFCAACPTNSEAKV